MRTKKCVHGIWQRRNHGPHDNSLRKSVDRSHISSLWGINEDANEGRGNSFFKMSGKDKKTRVMV